MKKNYIITSFLIALSICGFLFFNRSNITFKNILGEEIKDIKNNSLPFTIHSKEKIKVNGEIYESGRIYKEGCYKVSGGIFNKKICIKIPKEQTNYNFYISSATLATLYNSIIMASKSNEYSYIWYGRKGTMSIEYLKTQPNVILSDYIENKEVDKQSISEEIISKIRGILLGDKSAHFNLYIEDELNSYEYSIVAKLGLTEDRYNVYYVTNGTLSYVREYFNGQYTNYQNYAELQKKELDQIRGGENVEYRNPLMFLPILAQRKNTTYYLQYPDYFINEDENIIKEYKKINFISKSPKELLNELSGKQRESLFKSLAFDREKMLKEYFESDRPILIITGNTPIDYNYGNEKFKSLIKKVISKYSEKYKILFKPHPRALPDDDYILFFRENDIDVLPGTMPMEIISFSFDNLKLGGFSGSLYMSSNSDDVLFFFAKDRNDLFEPLNQMCDKEFKHAIFMEP